MISASELFEKKFYKEDDLTGSYDNETEKLFVNDLVSWFLEKNKEINEIGKKPIVGRGTVAYEQARVFREICDACEKVKK